MIRHGKTIINEDVDKPKMLTQNPVCVATSIMALQYKDGVAMVSDRGIMLGRTARFFHLTRQYKVNSHCIVSYSGDSPDFQWLQNFIERKQLELRSDTSDRKACLKPKMLHNAICSFLYYRRSKMDPLWNTIIVIGMQPVEFKAGEYQPYLGVVQKHGIAYEVKSAATGLASFLLNQLIENEYRNNNGELTRDQALIVLRDCMKIQIYRDTMANKEYDLSYVEKDGAVTLPPEEQVGDWAIADLNNDYN